MGRTIVGSLVLAAVLAAAGPLDAHTALSVTQDAIWRVDLGTQTGRRLVDLDYAPFFHCQHLAVSSSGAIRCALSSALFAIDGTTGEVSELPPALPVPPPLPGPVPPGSISGGLTFDAADRLWLADGAGTRLLQLDPDTGTVLSAQPLSLTGTSSHALAAFGDRLYALTRDGGTNYLEEIDPDTGMSLSTVELGVEQAIDAAFDDDGDLWLVTSPQLPTIPGIVCYRVSRVTPAMSAVEPVSTRCYGIAAPIFANIADVRGTVLEVPTLDQVGRLVLLGMLLLSALIVLRRTGA